MRTALIFILVFICNRNLSGQDLDSVGIDKSEVLNRQEVELLNALLKDKRGAFDFKGKKIAFVTGSAGSTILPKDVYFKSAVRPSLLSGRTPQISMVPLTEREKLKSNGYDVLVLSWVKVLTEKTKRKILNTLGKKS